MNENKCTLMKQKNGLTDEIVQSLHFLVYKSTRYEFLFFSLITDPGIKKKKCWIARPSFCPLKARTIDRKMQENVSLPIRIARRVRDNEISSIFERKNYDLSVFHDKCNDHSSSWQANSLEYPEKQQPCFIFLFPALWKALATRCHRSTDRTSPGLLHHFYTGHISYRPNVPTNDALFRAQFGGEPGRVPVKQMRAKWAKSIRQNVVPLFRPIDRPTNLISLEIFLTPLTRKSLGQLVSIFTSFHSFPLGTSKGLLNRLLFRNDKSNIRNLF